MNSTADVTRVLPFDFPDVNSRGETFFRSNGIGTLGDGLERRQTGAEDREREKSIRFT